MLTRRALLRRSAGWASGVAVTAGLEPLLAGAGDRGFQIGACDWSIGKHSDVESLTLAKEIGLDGVQVSLGTVDNDMHLRRPEIQQAYREAAERTGVRVASLAIGEMNAVPYKSDPRAEQWVADSIDVCRAMGTRVVLLAFFSKGDLRNDPKGVDEVVRRLKRMAPTAEKAGVILGLESWLSAKDHMGIIDRVASPNVQVYYDVANSTKMGYDIYEEIRWLGSKHICEFHAKENGALLGQGRIDFRKLRSAIDAIGYRGWMIIEGAVPRGKGIVESYKLNRAFLRTIFPPKA